MNYTILVTGSAYGTQNASTAFLFCQSLVKTSHNLHSVFFYCDGVLNANKMITPAIDEFNLIKAWKKLNKQHNVQLYVCYTAALRRGIIPDEEQLDINDNIKKTDKDLCFQFSGLIELAKSIKICDRIIQF